MYGTQFPVQFTQVMALYIEHLVTKPCIAPQRKYMLAFFYFIPLFTYNNAPKKWPQKYLLKHSKLNLFARI